MRNAPLRSVTRSVAVASAVGALLLAGAAPAAAHPLGNFTVNTASAVVVEPEAVRVDVVVDRAEIPTRQRFPALDDRSGELPGGTESPARADCAEVLAAARLTVDGRTVPLVVQTSELSFPAGAAGLRTARLVCGLRTADIGDLVGADVAFQLEGVSPAVGWHETTVSGDGVRLDAADVPEQSPTDYLRQYPEGQLSSPLDVSSARFSVQQGTGVATGAGGVLGESPSSSIVPRGADRLTEAFTDLVSREKLTVSFAAVAVAISLLLGALHAFAPGHGKTVMAAYLVGGRGSLRDALIIGASVTVTHTLGVLVLGAVLTVVGLSSPELAYPVLGTASGVLLIGIGLVLLRAARQSRRAAPAALPAAARVLVPAGVPLPTEHGPAQGQDDDGHQHHDDHQHHDHDDAHDHQHHDDAHDHQHHDDAHDHRHHDHQHHDDAHDHDHDHANGLGEHSHGLFRHTHALPEKGSGLKGLMAVGLAGGMVPSPSALVVLLGGIALGRAWFGFGLVVAYGLGMAAALMATGLLLVRARTRVEAMAARAASSRRIRLVSRAAAALPTATAALVVLVGVGVLLRAAVLL